MSDAKTEGQIAAGYDAIAEHLHESPEMYADSLALAGRVWGRVLDVGCGQGRLLELIRDRCPEVTELVGCDISPKLCDLARARVPSARVSVCNAERLDGYPDAYFDTTFIIGALEHVSDHIATLRAIRRVTRPGGTVVVVVPNRRWLRYDHWASMHVQEQPVDDHFFTPEELFGLCGKARLRVERVRGVWALVRKGWIHALENVAQELVPWLRTRMKCLGVRCRAV